MPSVFSLLGLQAPRSVFAYGYIGTFACGVKAGKYKISCTVVALAQFAAIGFLKAKAQRLLFTFTGITAAVLAWLAQIILEQQICYL